MELETSLSEKIQWKKIFRFQYRYCSWWKCDHSKDMNLQSKSTGYRYSCVFKCEWQCEKTFTAWQDINVKLFLENSIELCKDVQCTYMSNNECVQYRKLWKTALITFCVWKLSWSEKVPVEIILKKSHTEIMKDIDRTENVWLAKWRTFASWRIGFWPRVCKVGWLGLGVCKVQVDFQEKLQS